MKKYSILFNDGDGRTCNAEDYEFMDAASQDIKDHLERHPGGTYVVSLTDEYRERMRR